MIKYRAAVASYGLGSVSGIIGEDIFVLPDMRSEHLPVIMDACGVISETGGPLAHLAIVSREKGCVLMVMPDAAKLLRPGMSVVLNPKKCEIFVIE